MNNPQLLSYCADLLIFDDPADNLRVLSTILTEQGYHVRKVINGCLALKVVQIAPPHSILLDILMPDMNGYEVLVNNPSRRKAEGRRQKAEGKTISGGKKAPLIEDHQIFDLVGAWTRFGQGRTENTVCSCIKDYLFLLPSALCLLPCPKGWSFLL